DERLASLIWAFQHDPDPDEVPLTRRVRDLNLWVARTDHPHLRVACPCACPPAVFQPAAAQAVAAFEVRDSALGAGAVAGEAAPGAFRAGQGAPGDVDPLGGERGERLLARLRLKASVQRHLPRREPKPLELRDRVWQQLVLARIARRGGRREDEAARA